MHYALEVCLCMDLKKVYCARYMIFCRVEDFVLVYTYNWVRNAN